MQKIILYYKLTSVKKPADLRNWQTVLCAEHGLNGRTIVSDHGINGTLGGDLEALESYIEAMESTKLADFSGIEYKWSNGGYDDFPRLSVKVRKELVTLEAEEEFDPFNQGTPLRPKEWHDFIAQNPDVPIFDARNKYESDIGKFKSAITPKIDNFKEIPKELDKLDKNKPLLTYCTGDIRCEYLSAYMKHKGFKQVYHLDGGIVKYGERFKDDGFWEGKCYVFDRRMKLAFSDKSKDLGHCTDCQQSTSDHSNCANVSCNKLILKCADCQQKQPVCGGCLQSATT